MSTSLFTAGMPIRRLELDFIPSNVTSFDHIVKINFIRTPGLTGTLQFITMKRYVIDKSNDEFLDAVQYYLHYMSNSVYMSNDIFMGGLDLEANAKEISELTIVSSKIDEFRFLLDYMVDQDDVLLYTLTYRYKSVEYQTPTVMSYKPVGVKVLAELKARPCITLRNLRRRGANQSDKYDRMSKELYCDMRKLEEISTSMEDDMNTVVQSMDLTYISLYNTIDQVKYYQQYIGA